MLRISKLLLISLVLSRFAFATSASTKNTNSANRSAIASGTDQFGAYANSLAPTTTSTSASTARTSAASSNGTTTADSAAIAGNLNADSTPLAGDVNAATSTSGTTTATASGTSGTTSASTSARTPTAREISAVTGMPIAEATCLSSDRFIGKEKECLQAAKQLAPQLEVIAAVDERNQLATSGTTTAATTATTQTPAADAANRAVNDPQLQADLALLQKIVMALETTPDPSAAQQQGGSNPAALQQIQSLLGQ